MAFYNQLQADSFEELALMVGVVNAGTAGGPAATRIRDGLLQASAEARSKGAAFDEATAKSMRIEKWKRAFGRTGMDVKPTSTRESRRPRRPSAPSQPTGQI